ncbi:MAG: T9SS type A sorting domain-containing protein, partial [Bacteroidales bacterium]|nr:T9SS type A sorting domain-containing protein [Bacteroidales bacterium]
TKLAEGVTDVSNAQGLTGLSIYPNPASETTRLSVTVTAPQQVNINLVDVTGKALLQLENSYLTEGEYVYAPNLSGFNRGLYFINATFGTGAISKKMFIR